MLDPTHRPGGRMIRIREQWPREWWILGGLAALVVAACVPFFDRYELVATGIAKAVGFVALPALGLALARTLAPLRVEVDPWRGSIAVRRGLRRWRRCPFDEVLAATYVTSDHPWLTPFLQVEVEELELWTHPPVGWRRDASRFRRPAVHAAVLGELLDDDPDLRAFVVPLDRLAADDVRTVMGSVPAATWATVEP